MSNVWQPRSVSTKGQPVTVAATQTDAPLTDNWRVTSGGAIRTLLEVTVTAASTSTDLQLQTSIGGQDWEDRGSVVSFSAPGKYYVYFNGSPIPMLSLGRLVCTTGASPITISSVKLLQED